jgi:hypothetical protein
VLEVGRYMPVYHTKTYFYWISYRHVSIYTISIFRFFLTVYLVSVFKKYTVTSKFPFRALEKWVSISYCKVNFKFCFTSPILTTSSRPQVTFLFFYCDMSQEKLFCLNFYSIITTVTKIVSVLWETVISWLRDSSKSHWNTVVSHGIYSLHSAP